MTASSKAFVRGSLAMLGTIIGAGVFGVPYAMKSMGVLAGSIVFWVIALAILATHLLFADIVFHDVANRGLRLPGHVRRILGDWPGFLALVSHPFSIIGACFAYLLLGGEFLSTFFRAIGIHIPVLGWELLFWAGGAVTVLFGLKVVSRVALVMSWTLITLLLLSISFFLPATDILYLTEAHWSGVLGSLGILVFALSGYTFIPEVIEICGRNEKRSRRAIITGSLLAAFLTWAFGVFGYIAIGHILTPNPTDVSHAFPPAFFWLLPAVGFLAVASVFITITQDLKAMIHLEMRIPKTIAWAVALGAPLLLVLFARHDFLGTVGFVGSIFGSINGILICAMGIVHLRSKRFPGHRKYVGVAVVCGALFLLTFIWRILNLE